MFIQYFTMFFDHFSYSLHLYSLWLSSTFVNLNKSDFIVLPLFSSEIVWSEESLCYNKNKICEDFHSLRCRKSISWAFEVGRRVGGTLSNFWILPIFAHFFWMTKNSISKWEGTHLLSVLNFWYWIQYISLMLH